MKKIGTRLALTGFAAFVLGTLWAAPASAQATRTWVSGVGDDANPCSRTAPCKTFAGAISKTAAGGEINCLDPGAYGAVTITKAISIICQYTEAGVLATLGSSGIIINAGANDHIYLSGLDLNGAGSGLNGVRFVNGASLTIENSVIRNFAASNGRGVSFQPSGAARLNISNTTINNNGTGATGSGIHIQPTGTLGTARVMLAHVRVQSNANTGFSIDTTGATGANGISVSIEHSVIDNNTNGINVLQPASTQAVGMMIAHTSVSNNSGTGIIAAGGGTVLRVGDTTITGNGAGVTASGGATIASYGDNRLDGNPAVGALNNGAFSGTIPEQ